MQTSLTESSALWIVTGLDIHRTTSSLSRCWASHLQLLSISRSSDSILEYRYTLVDNSNKLVRSKVPYKTKPHTMLHTYRKSRCNEVLYNLCNGFVGKVIAQYGTFVKSCAMRLQGAPPPTGRFVPPQGEGSTIWERDVAWLTPMRSAFNDKSLGARSTRSSRTNTSDVMMRHKHGVVTSYKKGNCKCLWTPWCCNSGIQMDPNVLISLKSKLSLLTLLCGLFIANLFRWVLCQF